MKVKIFNIPIPSNSFDDLLMWTKGALRGAQKKVVAKAPSEFLLRAEKNVEFKQFLVESDLLVPDGIGVLWAAKYLSIPITKAPLLRQLQALWQMLYSGIFLLVNHSYAKDILPERLSGVEVLYTMFSACEFVNKSVYIFGARPEILEKAIMIIKKRYPTLKIAGSHDGYSDKGQNVIDDINKCKPELLIVALGSPEQEFWIRDNISKLNSVRVAVGEGGSFDAISGATKRAPKIIQKMGLEWLWRGLFAKNLTGQGHRIKRIWNAVPVFIFHVVKYKLEVNK